MGDAIKNCPCHSGKPYEACCGPYHSGALPPTPLDLMRSRFSGFALGNEEYIIETLHPDHPDSTLPLDERKAQIAEFCQKTRFEGLEILDSGEDFVTFRAILSQNGRDCSFIERSQFAQINGKWLYLSGEISG